MSKVNVEGVEVHYKESGEKGLRPIIFIHGAGGSAATFSPVLDALKESAHAIALDLPGHGESAGRGKSKVSEYREIAREFIETLNLDSPPILAGHSMGGAITLEVALTYPELLSGIGLVGTGAKLRVHPMIFKAIEEDFEGYLKTSASLAFSPKTDKAIIEEHQRNALDTEPEVALNDFKACDVFDVRNNLSEIKLPTLILCGTDDQLTPAKYSHFLHEHISGSELKIFDDAGHMLPIEKPEAVAQEFIDQLEAGHIVY